MSNKADYRFNAPFYIRSCKPEKIKLYFDLFIDALTQHERRKAGDTDYDVPDPHLLLIVDDALDCSINFDSVKQQTYWRDLLSTARHKNITVVFVVQTLHRAIPPAIRSMIKIWYIFKNGVEAETLLKMLPLVKRKDGKTITKASELKEYLQNALDTKYSALYFRRDEHGPGLYGKLFHTVQAPSVEIEYKISRT